MITVLQLVVLELKFRCRAKFNVPIDSEVINKICFGVTHVKLIYEVRERDNSIHLGVHARNT